VLAKAGPGPEEKGREPVVAQDPGFHAVDEMFPPKIVKDGADVGLGFGLFA